ncbi:hypothetical protein DPMN_027712 [Dreissena polymorpha]|uniref:Uncharacterized protein n=1 Tax=Dreissena polymorpha TaxID=45954 RepID=A0A9D4LVU0_DREPO|nr:hypothetical protein DPMN_027712 [Dreissena polymorpha]
MMRSMNFMEWLMNLMARLLLRLSLFGRWITRDWAHSLDHLFSSQIFLHSAVIAAVVASSQCLISSKGTGDVPACILRSASSNSAFDMDKLSSSASDMGSL